MGHLNYWVSLKLELKRLKWVFLDMHVNQNAGPKQAKNHGYKTM